MKFFIINIFVIAISLLFISKVYAEPYCPTMEEFKSKNSYFQQQALKNMSSNHDLNVANRLLSEQSAYMDNLYPSCFQYFQISKKPDCSKLLVLSTAYLMLKNDEKLVQKTKLLNLVAPFEKTCSGEVHTLRILAK